MIKNNQTIFDSSDCIAEHSKWSEFAVDDYIAIGEGVTQIIDLVNNGGFSPILGTGSPESVVTSNYSLKYIDTGGPTEYYNPVFGADTGWIAL